MHLVGQFLVTTPSRLHPATKLDSDSHSDHRMMLLGGMVTNAFVAAPLRADRMSSVSLRMSAGGEPMLSRRSAAAGAAAAAAVLFAQVLPAQAECSKFSPLCGSLPDVVALTAPGSDSDSVPAAFRSIKGSPFDNEARADAESNSVQALLCQLASQSASRSVSRLVGRSVGRSVRQYHTPSGCREQLRAGASLHASLTRTLDLALLLALSWAAGLRRRRSTAVLVVVVVGPGGCGEQLGAGMTQPVSQSVTLTLNPNPNPTQASLDRKKAMKAEIARKELEAEAP